jgi:hypothetical protein
MSEEETMYLITRGDQYFGGDGFGPNRDKATRFITQEAAEEFVAIIFALDLLLETPSPLVYSVEKVK